MKAKPMLRACILGALATTVTAVVGCSGGGDSNKAGGERQPPTMVLTLATHGLDTLDLDAFASELARQSDGSVRLAVKKGWRAGQRDYQQRMIADVRSGKTELAAVPARAFDSAGVNSFQPLIAPFAVDSYALEGRVLGSPVARRMLRGVGQIGLVGVALLPAPLHKPLGISRALVDASDYRGAKLGIPPSEIGARTLRLLGARPEYYEQGGATASLDGVVAGVSSIEGDRSDVSARTLAANVNLWAGALVIVMNRDAYEALSDEQQKALQAAGRAAVKPDLKLVVSFEQEALRNICNRGAVAFRSASASQLDALRASTRPISEALDRNPATRDSVRAIAAMRASVEPEAPPTCRARNQAGSAERATPVDGLWQVETTAQELAQIAPPGEVIPENWGRLTFAAIAGRFAFSNENQQACIWAYGSYVIKGDIVEWTFKDGGGDAPTDASNRPGEFFRFRWSRYRDRLTLAPVNGAISPEAFRVKPWRLLGGQPSISRLSSRCPPPPKALQP